MKTKDLVAVVVGLSASFQLASAADITGKVTLNGAAPAEREITPLENDATCGKLHPGKTVIVDADMRRPRMHEALGRSQEPGLSNVLVGDTALPDATRVASVSLPSRPSRKS